MNDGAISFDKEVKFNLSEEGEPEGVYFKVSKDANHLIEEFMLLLIKKVAEFIGKQRKHLFIEFMMSQMKINFCKAVIAIWIK
jgi:exoribonuclease R